jgi:cysteine-rich repeat protein
MRRLGFTTTLLVLAACSPTTGGLGDSNGTDDSTSTGSDCQPGEFACECTASGSCDAGLECVAGMCMAVSGDGDPDSGDGDPDSGDGDPDSGDGDPDSGDGDPPCTDVGCACDGSPGSCDPDLVCEGGSCIPNTCGDGNLDEGEQCDDGNDIDGDGCDNDCTYTEILQLAAGSFHTCAVIENGRLRCWGKGSDGVLGYGNGDAIGDNEHPYEAGDVSLPSTVEAIAAGGEHNCATFADGELRCWGRNNHGQLGYASDVNHIGVADPLTELAGVDIGGTLEQFGLGGLHGCVRFATNDVRCWGLSNYGQLGYNSTDTIGVDEHPSEAPMVMVGAEVLAVAGGFEHTCAITTDHQLRCWGRSNRGQLGYGNTSTIGNDEHPDEAGNVVVYPESLPEDATLSQVSLGREHSCVLFGTGDVLCWGRNNRGQLGQGNTTDWGDNNNETPAQLDPINLGGAAVAIAAGDEFSCALLEGGAVRCWGYNNHGQLGLGNTANLGHNNSSQVISVAPIVLGKNAIHITAGATHACAVLEDHTVICWGENPDGRLGYGHTNKIGDNETPASAGPIQLLAPL